MTDFEFTITGTDDFGDYLGERKTAKAVISQVPGPIFLNFYQDEMGEAIRFSHRLTELYTGNAVALFIPPDAMDDAFLLSQKWGLGGKVERFYRAHFYLFCGHENPFGDFVAAPSSIFWASPNEDFYAFLEKMNMIFNQRLRIVPSGELESRVGGVPQEFGYSFYPKIKNFPFGVEIRKELYDLGISIARYLSLARSHPPTNSNFENYFRYLRNQGLIDNPLQPKLF